MRAVFIALFSLVMSVSAAQAARPCHGIAVSKNRGVTVETKGYHPVILYVEVPVKAGVDVQSVARKADVLFWIGANVPNIRNDRALRIQKIQQCLFLQPGSAGKKINKLYLTVRTEVLWEAQTDHSYLLSEGILLPKKLVAKRPHVETVLDSGETLEGVWEDKVAPQTGRKYTILWLLPKEK